MHIEESVAGWRLDYQVVAFGAYATILVESVSLILGGIEDASAFFRRDSCFSL